MNQLCSKRTYVVFLGPVGFFLKKANDYYILFRGCISGSDRTIASERQSTALATLYIGGSVTCSHNKTQGA